MKPVNPLMALLPTLLPLAGQWLQIQEAVILARGIPLTPRQLKDAREAGVRCPENIRLLTIPTIPLPTNPILQKVAREAGLLGPGTAGLTLRYGIYIRDDVRFDRELHIHEFVHVGQYERLGSIEAFLRDYLQECIDPGYPHGPLEQEAIVVSRRVMEKFP